MGPSRGAIRRPSVYLRNTGFFTDRVIDRGATEYRNSSVPDGTRTALDSAAARFSNRNAGGNPERHPRIMGHFRHDPLVARFSVPMAETPVRLDAVLQRADLRNQHARWRNHYCHHDSADNYLCLTGDLA